LNFVRSAKRSGAVDHKPINYPDIPFFAGQIPPLHRDRTLHSQENQRQINHTPCKSVTARTRHDPSKSVTNRPTLQNPCPGLSENVRRYSKVYVEAELLLG
jgi:hypothetical protein